MNKIELYDTTLRDGLQNGLEISLVDAIRFFEYFATMGIDYFEAGFASADPRHKERIIVLTNLAKEKYPQVKIAAFGRTRGRAESAQTALDLREILTSQAPIATLVGKTRISCVLDSLRVTAQQNLDMIKESIRYMVDHNRVVFFDAEHFFNALLEDRSYALACLIEAHTAGASRIILCDTNGGSDPECVAEGVYLASTVVPTEILGIHTHNDQDLATANVMTAVKHGVKHVQGTINGYGERAGNANLCTIIPNLLIRGFDSISEEQLTRLKEGSYLTASLFNLSMPDNAPWVGDNAFRTLAGMHTAGELRSSGSYTHADPALVGNRFKVGLSDQSGKSTTLLKLKEMGYTDLIEKQIEAVHHLVTSQIKKGYSYEIADASFDLLVQQILDNETRQLFDKFEYHVNVPQSPQKSEAVIKASKHDQSAYIVDEGIGPVDAFSNALRKTLAQIYPHINFGQLVDYKVKILNYNRDSAATVRVTIETTDGTNVWFTVGVHENIIEASKIALLDSCAYALIK